MTVPRRIQLRRTKGWRKPEGAVVVARPSRWGNPPGQSCHADVLLKLANPDLFPVGG